MLRRHVCSVDAVAPGCMRGVEVAGLDAPVLVAHVDGKLYVTASTCPHENVSLLGGTLCGTQVICPAHHYRFDLRTGACDPLLRLRLHYFKTVVSAGQLYIELA